MEFSFLAETNPDAPALAKLAESCGFGSFFLLDSHVAWREVYPYLTLCVRDTSRIRIGTLVTNPLTRHPTVTASAFATLQEISGGRMVLGIARGDSSLRALGERIATVAEYRSRTKLIHRLANGETVQYKPKQPGHEKWLAQSGGKVQNLHFHWLQSPSRIPLYMGGYGPRALRVAGELADAVVVQAIDNEIVRWALDHTHEGARQAGRNPSDIRMVVSGPVVVSNDVKKARNDLRWFVQAIWNHVSDVLEHHDRSTLPANLVLGLPVDFRSDYSEHVQREAGELAQVPDAAVDALTIFGPVERCVERLQELAARGTKEFIAYGLAMPRDEIEATMRSFGDHIIPRFQ